MPGFAFCPKKNCAIEILVPGDTSCDSLITTDNSDNYLNQILAKCGICHQIELCDEDKGISFNLPNQVTLHINSDTTVLLDDDYSDATTVNSTCSAATQGTTTSFLQTPINYKQ